MSLTPLDAKPALVLIDLQKGHRRGGMVSPIDEVIGRAAQLAAGFRRRQLPVVLVNVAGQAPGRTDTSPSGAPAFAPPPGYIDFVEELGAQADDHRITKQTWGAFHGTPLDDLLRGLGVTQVVLAGVATSLGVESTARSAYEHGYNVVLATDAMTDRDPDMHANSVSRIFPRLGETATTNEILDLLKD